MHPALASAAFLSIVLFFFYFAGGGLHAYFTSDDVMNLAHLHGYFTTPIYKVALDVLNPLTSAYRPLGGLFYRLLYPVIGFHPAPFRAVCFALLIVNLAFAFRLLRLLSDSLEAALLGTLAISYHAAMFELYYNTGTIYDLLCYMLVVVALSSYIVRRKRNCKWSGAYLIGLLVLDLLALQAKEMACILPVVLFLYEIWYRRIRMRELAPIVLTGLLTAASLLYRLLTPNVVSDNPLYHPTLSLDFFLHSCARYHNMLLYSNDLFDVPGLLCTWAAMALIAAALRSRPMIFGLSFWIAGLIPIAVIPGRAGFVLYLPLVGLALYFAVLLARIRNALLKMAPVPRLASQAALFAVLMAGLAAAHAYGQSEVLPGLLQLDRDSRAVLTELRSIHPRLNPKAQLLLVDDPFPADSRFLLFGARLLYNDPTIYVDRVKSQPRMRFYNYVMSYAGGRLIDLPHLPCPIDTSSAADPIDDSSLRVCWQGAWTSGEFPQSLGGTVTFTNQKDATAKIAFEGSSLKYIYTKAYNRGLAAVTVDGMDKGVIDEYSPGIVWQASTDFNGFKPGKHTAEVRVLHQRDSAASDSYVDVDAFIPR
ncbi:MAG: hypothetical protein M3Z85_09380 [Acidobacteriota bacterium]|nr:hypothetical protein [Acidobacteriota bacterium]